MKKILSLAALIVLFSVLSLGQTKEGPIDAYQDYLVVCETGQVEKCKQRYTAASLKLIAEQAKEEGKTLNEALSEKVVPRTKATVRIIRQEKLSAIVVVKKDGSGAEGRMLMRFEDGRWKVALAEWVQLFTKAIEALADAVDKVEKEDAEIPFETPETKNRTTTGSRNGASESDDSVKRSRPRSKPFGQSSETKSSIKEPMPKFPPAAKWTCALRKGIFDTNSDFVLLDAFKNQLVFTTTNDFKVFNSTGTKQSVKAENVSAKFRGLSLKPHIETREPFLLDVFKSENPKLRIRCLEKDRADYEVYNPDGGRWIRMLALREDGVWKAAPNELVEEIAAEILTKLKK